MLGKKSRGARYHDLSYRSRWQEGGHSTAPQIPTNSNPPLAPRSVRNTSFLRKYCNFFFLHYRISYLYASISGPGKKAFVSSAPMYIERFRLLEGGRFGVWTADHCRCLCQWMRFGGREAMQI